MNQAYEELRATNEKSTFAAAMPEKVRRIATLQGSLDRRLTSEEQAEVREILTRVLRAKLGNKAIEKHPYVSTEALFAAGYLLNTENTKHTARMMSDASRTLFDIHVIPGYIVKDPS